MTKNEPPADQPPLRLQKFRRNQIFEAVEAAGLDPREFDFELVDAGVRLKHRWSESYFFVGGDPGHYVGHYVIGDSPDWPYDTYSWDGVMLRVDTWLGLVKVDLATPDLWAELRNEAELLGPSFDEGAENTPFTADEQKEIAKRLQELAEYARHAGSLSEAQM